MSQPGPVEISLAELVEDYSIYPRHKVDERHVTYLCNALRSGATLPPIVVEAVSKRIVDGWHRVHAYRKVFGEGALVLAFVKQYASEVELLKEAAATNAAHGRKLDQEDRVRIIVLLEKHGVLLSEIAAVLHEPEERVVRLRLRQATTPLDVPEVVPGTMQVILNPATEHLSQQVLSEKQAAALRSVPGLRYDQMANFIRQGLESDLVDLNNERVLLALRQLRDLLVTVLAD